MSDLAIDEPVDLAHLERYTGGDVRLNAEVFQLFSRHSLETLRKLERLSRGPERKAWREAAHSLKGAAMGIGAFELAFAAGDAEAMDPAAAPERTAAVLRRLQARSQVVQAFIEAYLAA
ncbi:MAG TPA: Hpt domain-containing protein [Rhizomicrobium sp.]|jgi:HPt (histidine-containing phosphotransfer) domain-containing protein|nr:Hpt domain-containing protein [Rhizomicrobium sp.]